MAACAPGWLAILGLTDAAACGIYYTPPCEAALAAPHSGWSPALVEQCADAVGAMSCPPLLLTTALPAICSPHGGTLPDGEPCSTPWQCMSGGCPIRYLDTCGTCAPVVQQNPASLGDACTDSTICPTNAGCDETTHVCAKLPGLGQTCDPNVSAFCDLTNGGTRCDSASSRCEAVVAIPPGGTSNLATFHGQCNGTFLPTGDAGVGTCTPFLQPGASCGAGDNCTLGFICASGVCTPVTCD